MLLCCLGYPQMPELQWAIGASQVIGTTGGGQTTGFSFSDTALHNSRDLTWAWGSQGIKKWQRWCNVIQMNREVGFMVYSQQRRQGLWYTIEQGGGVYGTQLNRGESGSSFIGKSLWGSSVRVIITRRNVPVDISAHTINIHTGT